MARFDVSTVGSRIAAWARGYSPFQLIVAGMLAFVLVAGGIFLVNRANAPTYALLYSQLDPADTASIGAELDAGGVPYEISEAGDAIKVPVEMVGSAKVTLAAAGLPKQSAVGYEALDGQPLTTSSAREQVNIQRALEGNIANTLMGVDGVESATVQLAIPKDELFTDNQSPVTAAVTVTTARTLSDAQVEAIVHLVASSVQDLDPSSVTVVDSKGNLLAGASGIGAGGSDVQAKATAAKQAELTATANGMLAEVVGPGKAVVRVAAELTFDQRSEQSEKFANPADAPCPPGTAAGTTCQLLTGSSTAQETYSATEPSNLDPLTTVPNTTLNGATDGTGTANGTTGTGTGTTTQGGQNYESSKDDSAYALDRTVTSQVDAIGKVSRLTVAVVVDDTVPMDDAAVEALIANAVGLDTDRGDEITVQRTAFAAENVEVVIDEPAPEVTMLEQYSGWVGGGLLALVGFALMMRLLRSRTEEIDVEEVIIPAVGDPLDDEALRAAAARDRLEPAGGLRSEAEMLLARIDENPRDAADVLRGWMAEDTTGR